MPSCFVTLLMAAALAAAEPGFWDPWRPLLGEWVGEGAGQGGQSAGSFSFQLDLAGRVLVRKNGASAHEDLMVVYRDPGDKSARAVYFDNEGHVIHYRAAAAGDGAAWTFVSDPVANQPRFRLTYTKAPGGVLKIRFEITPPGKPDSFSTYLEGTARRSSEAP